MQQMKLQEHQYINNFLMVFRDIYGRKFSECDYALPAGQKTGSIQPLISVALISPMKKYFTLCSRLCPG